jgi:hypothetical protein
VYEVARFGIVVIFFFSDPLKQRINPRLLVFPGGWGFHGISGVDIFCVFVCDLFRCACKFLTQ